MTRETAFKLAGAVADAGYSCQVAIGVHPTLAPREHCSVHVRTTHFEAAKLGELIEIGEQHGVELHLAGDDLRYVEGPRYEVVR